MQGSRPSAAARAPGVRRAATGFGALSGAASRPVRPAHRPADAGGAPGLDRYRGRRHRLRRRPRSREPVLGTRARSRAFLAAPDGRRGLGYRRAIPQGAVAAHQRPQPPDAVRGRDRAAAIARRDAGAATRAASSVAALARAVAQPARCDHRAGPVTPAHDRGPGAACPGRASGGARGDAREGPGTARGARSRPVLRQGDCRQLLASLCRLHVGRAGPVVEPALRRDRARQLLESRVRGGGQRDHLRALSPQPHGLPAALVRGVSQGFRGAAHRGREQSRPAGDRPLSATRRRVLPAPQLRRQHALRRSVHDVPGPDDGARPFHRVLHRGRPQPDRASPAPTHGDAGNDGAELSTRAAAPVARPGYLATSGWSKAAHTSASCPAAPRKRNRCCRC